MGRGITAGIVGPPGPSCPVSFEEPGMPSALARQQSKEDCHDESIENVSRSFGPSPQ